MRFIRILTPDISEAKVNFVNSLLKKKISNDYVMESVFIPMIIHPDSPVQLFYRSFWCDLYLKQPDHRIYPDIYDVEQPDELDGSHPIGRSVIYMSLSECLQFINQVTPPALQKDIPSNTESIEAIQKLMQFFLFEEKDNKLRAYYATTFYKVFHLEMFENNWEPDFKKIAFIREKMKTYELDDYGAIVASLDASMKSLSEIINFKDDEWFEIPRAKIQMTFHADTDDDIWTLYDFLNLEHFHICHLYCSEIGLFVSAYCDHVSSDTRRFIKSIYSEIMK